MSDLLFSMDSLVGWLRSEQSYFDRKIKRSLWQNRMDKAQQALLYSDALDKAITALRGHELREQSNVRREDARRNGKRGRRG